MSHIKLKYWNKCSNFVKIIIFKWNLIFYIQDTPYLWLWNHVHVCVYAVLTGVIFLEFIRYFLKWFHRKNFFFAFEFAFSLELIRGHVYELIFHFCWQNVFSVNISDLIESQYVFKELIWKLFLEFF